MIDLVAAEWLKLRTIRLLYAGIPAAVILSCAAVAGEIFSGHAVGPSGLATSEGVRRVFAVTGAGAILIMVVGVVIAAGEYRHGTAGDTFLTTPRRERVVVAKLVVGAGVGLGGGLLIAGSAIAVARVAYAIKGVTFPMSSSDVWLTLLGAVVYSTLFAALGVGLGAMVRNQTLAVAGSLAWFAAIEHTMVNLVPDLGRWFPAAAGQAIVRTPIDGLLSPLAGVALLVVYVAAAAVAGARLAATRDA